MMNPSPAPKPSSSRGRLAVVSGLAHNSMAPRGQRTQNLVGELGKRWDVELVALPAETFEQQRDAPVSRQPLTRRVLGSAMRSVALDRWELWAARRLRGWDPDVDAALLVGYPWSPVTRAARALARRGIPYVVDAGDPWVVTEPASLPRTISVWRARHAELPIWRNAAGAVVTTPQQGDRLKEMFPHLPVMARPNGYVPTPSPAARPRADRDPASLTLAHFGTLSPIRVEVAPLLAALQATGCWDTIAFAQFGDDYAGMLERAPEGVRIERHRSRPWAEIVARAGDFDAAVVLGNQRGYLLPSKAVQYLTLPIPRIAVTNGEPDDALAAYAAVHPGWMAVHEGDPEAGRRVRDHVRHAWTAEQLAAPEAESWANVAVEVAAFIESCVVHGETDPERQRASLAGGGV
jgi:hypothetical protein